MGPDPVIVSPAEEARTSGATAPKTVLLVEDNEDTRQIYTVSLERDGYRVIPAGDGEAGIALAHVTRPDVILMNVVIPSIDGWTATRLLKQDPATRDIPLIVVTAFQKPTDRELAEQWECQAYLEKPCPPSRLVEEVRKLIGDA